MTDLFAKFNGINSQLQRAQFDHNKICYFCILKKIHFVEGEFFGRIELSQFLILSDLHQNSEMPYDTQVYCQHLETLHKGFYKRFEDILALEFLQWVMNPLASIETAEIQIQEELVEFSTNKTLKANFQNGDRLTEFCFQGSVSCI